MKINQTKLQFNIGEPFTFRDFEIIQDNIYPQITLSELQSILYHFRCLTDKGEFFEPILIDDEFDVIDGYHRIAALSYFNYCYPDKTIDEIEVIIDK